MGDLQKARESTGEENDRVLRGIEELERIEGVTNPDFQTFTAQSSGIENAGTTQEFSATRKICGGASMG